MDGSTALTIKKRLARLQSGLSSREYKILEKLSTPILIQNFLDSVPINYEKNGDTHMSPRRVPLEKTGRTASKARFSPPSRFGFTASRL